MLSIFIYYLFDNTSVFVLLLCVFLDKINNNSWKKRQEQKTVKTVLPVPIENYLSQLHVLKWKKNLVKINFLHYLASHIFKQNVFYVNGPFGCWIISYCFFCFVFLKTINEHLHSVSFSYTLTICFKTLENTLGKRHVRFGLCLHVTGYSIDTNCSPQKQNIVKNYAVSHQKQKNESPGVVF